jgi:crossover junction endodeoxyribonuclease RuvC
MRIIGVDPGNLATGFGVVERGSAFRSVASGTIRMAGMERGPTRLAYLHARLLDVINSYRPEAMSLERSFVAVNVQSAFALGEARAVAMLAAAHCNIEVSEYTPTDVKLSVAGYGRADKTQVKAMVRRTLNLDEAEGLADDAADALAIALCHLFRLKMPLPTNTRRRSSRPVRVSL